MYFTASPKPERKVNGPADIFRLSQFINKCYIAVFRTGVIIDYKHN